MDREDIVSEVAKVWDRRAMEDELTHASIKIMAQHVEIEQLRAALQGLVGAIADPTSQRSIPDALKEARAVLTQKANDVC